MAAHLAHKIPWETLCDLNVQRHAVWYHGGTPAQYKKAAHAGRVIARTLRDFQSTAKATPEEMALLNARTWGISEGSYGGYTGYYHSLLEGYIELNLLLADPERAAPLLHDGSVVGVLLGHNDGGHPSAISAKLAPAFDDGGHLKPLTAEVMQTLRDHAALLFRCMYLLPGENTLLDDDWVASTVCDYFGCYNA